MEVERVFRIHQSEEVHTTVMDGTGQTAPDKKERDKCLFGAVIVAVRTTLFEILQNFLHVSPL
jgi:hypothetical protein